MIHKAVLREVHETGDVGALISLIPYAETLGMSCVRFGDDVIFTLPPKDSNLGNPILPAIHGGVLGGFMEMSAMLYLMLNQDAGGLPRIVDFSIDYLRAGLNQNTFAECRLTRQGKRVANVTVSCWQKSRSEPIATARAHFIFEP